MLAENTRSNDVQGTLHKKVEANIGETFGEKCVAVQKFWCLPLRDSGREDEEKQWKGEETVHAPLGACTERQEP